MSASEQPGNGNPPAGLPNPSYTPTGNTFPVHRSVISVQPDEPLAPLSKVQFQVLLDGETNSVRSGRDLCLGIFASGLYGFIALILTVDWSSAFKGAKWAPFVWTGVLLAATTAAGVGAGICQLIHWRKGKTSAYSAVMEYLRGHFSM